MIRDKPNYAIDAVIRYWVGTPPGYLDQGKVRAEAHSCFEAWAAACPLAFKRVEVRELADICVEWRYYYPPRPSPPLPLLSLH